MIGRFVPFVRTYVTVVAGVTRMDRGRFFLWSLVAALSVTMVVTSLSLNWHWFADLIAGLIVGGMVLELSVAADAALSATAFDNGLRSFLRDCLEWVRRRTASLARRNPLL